MNLIYNTLKPSRQIPMKIKRKINVYYYKGLNIDSKISQQLESHHGKKTMNSAAEMGVLSSSFLVSKREL